VPRRSSTPDARAADQKKRIEKVRRRYNKDVTKNRKIHPAQAAFVENMVCIMKLGRYSNTQIAKAMGIGRAQVAEILERPQVTEMLVTLQSKIPEAALSIMEGYAVEAVVSIAEVMRTSEDDKYVLQAAGEILDRTGLPKVSKSEQKRTTEETVEITGDSLVAALREASPEIQEQAAVLVEQLEGLLATAADETGDDDE
jgi:transcriptional regulator of aromatic amino acid metabolism